MHKATAVCRFKKTRPELPVYIYGCTNDRLCNEILSVISVLSVVQDFCCSDCPQALDALLQTRLDELIQIPIQHALRIADLDIGAQILDA